MEKAYVLLTVEMGSWKGVLNALDEISDVKEAHKLYGTYDFMVHIEAETPQELKDLIARVKGIGNIRSAMPLICTARARGSPTSH